MAERQDERAMRDDELLSAYLDGELGAGEHAELERRIAGEPALARRLEALSRANRAVGQAFASLADEPLPPALRELLGQTTDSEAPQPASAPQPVSLQAAGRRRRRWTVMAAPRAMAAGIVLAIGIGLGLSLALRDSQPDGGPLTASTLLTAERELFGILESVPSGSEAALTAERTASPRLSFRTAGGGYCRELELDSPAGPSALVACRETGGWRVEAVAGVEAAAGADGEAFVPASGAGSELDETIDRLMAGPPLGAEAERRAIDSGWQIPAAAE